MSFETAQRRRGLIITTLGVLILTPDSLLVRLAGLDAWTMAAWRGVIEGLALLAGIVVFMPKLALTPRLTFAFLLAVAAYATNSIAFVYALGHTTVANVMLIVATTPLVTAALAYFLIGERLPRRTWIAMAVVLAGIAWVVSDSLGTTRLDGDIAAVIAVVFFCLILVLARRDPDLPIVSAVAYGGLFSALLAGLAAWVLGDTFFNADAISEDAATWASLNGLVIALSFALIVWGPKFLPAAEVGLILMLETVIAPLWVWWALGEAPGARTLEGGAVVLAALVGHTYFELRAERPGPPTA